jgi:hypothetical protein
VHRSRDIAMSKRTWRYLKPICEQHGPVSSADLRAAAQLDFLSAEDLVQRTGAHDWIKAGLITGLFGAENNSFSLPMPRQERCAFFMTSTCRSRNRTHPRSKATGPQYPSLLTSINVPMASATTCRG